MNNSNMSNIDTNVANYTMSELMAISGVSNLDSDEITSQTNTFISKYKESTIDPIIMYLDNIEVGLFSFSKSDDIPILKSLKPFLIFKVLNKTKKSSGFLLTGGIHISPTILSLSSFMQ